MPNLRQRQRVQPKHRKQQVPCRKTIAYYAKKLTVTPTKPQQEFIMQKYQYIPIALIAIAIITGCSTVTQTPPLAEAHSSYNSARTNPDVTNLAAVELKEAGDTLNKADYALSNSEDTETVDHLAYLAKQKVGIAEETAKRKTAELAVTNAGVKRNEVRLEARTAEADAAKAQVAELLALNAQKTDRGMVITLGDILFSTGKSQLKPDGVRNVQKARRLPYQIPTK
ncbi:MAG: DUF4398 domain-containing protein [Methyloglobulus sp.]